MGARRGANLQTERSKFPAQIVALPLEVRRSVDALTSVTGSARRNVEARLEDASDQLARAETPARRGQARARQPRRDRGRGVLGHGLPREFHQIWDVLTAENRGRLVRAVIQRVEVDEPANQIKVSSRTSVSTRQPP